MNTRVNILALLSIIIAWYDDDDDDDDDEKVKTMYLQ